MALSPRLIRRRIRSVQNTKKITKAMELVAAAKMRRAVAAALKTRAYATLAWQMVESLHGMRNEELHPLLRARQNKIRQKNLYIVMASDRGLCGGFNAALFREVIRDAGAVGQFIAVGKKAEQFIRRQGWKLIASFTNISVAPAMTEVRPIAKVAMEAFIGGEADETRIAFTDFISSLRQQPRVRTLLPLRRIDEIGVGNAQFLLPAPSEFLFEPSPDVVLAQMLPRLVELQVYQCYLETGASEHSARMIAMRNASDAARDMVDDLSLSFNQARQALITREIAEIAAGRAALN